MSSVGSTVANVQPLVPAFTSPTIDGSGTGSGASVTSVAATLTTTKTNDIIVAVIFVATSGVVVSSVSDTSSLTWTQFSSTPSGIFIYWAFSSGVLSSDSITATLSATGTAGIIVFGVNGANTTYPFDPILTPAEYNSSVGTATSLSYSVTTYLTNELLIGILATPTTGETFTVGSGFTSIASVNTNVSLLVEYKSITATNTTTSVTASVNTAAQLYLATTAIQSAPMFSIQPPSGQEWIIHNIFYQAPCQISFGSTNSNTFATIYGITSGFGVLAGLLIHVTSASYLVIEPIQQGVFGYNGVRTV
jgi:hypothetical protein